VQPVLREPSRFHHTKSVAVLPLRIDATGSDIHLRDGFTEELIDGLAMCPGLRVKPRSATGGVDPAAEYQQVGRELGVQVVVEGSFGVRDETIAVRIAAVSVDEGFQIWARRFERPKSELLRLSAEVVSALADALTVEGGADREVMTDTVAIDLYLRARAALWANWSSPNLASEDVRAMWEDLLARVPDDPRSLAGAATYYTRVATIWAAPDAAERASELAARAIEAGPDSPEPYNARALIAWSRGELHEALASGRRALELAPHAYGAMTTVGKILLELGPLNEGLELLQRAHDADPRVCHLRLELARGRALQGDWEAVDRLLAPECDHPSMQFMLSLQRVRLDLWRPEPAWLDAPINTAEGDPELLFFFPSALYVLRTGRVPVGLEAFGERYAQGKPRLAGLAYQCGCELAVRGGDEDLAWRMLTKAVDAGLYDLMWLVYCPALEPIRGTERFQAVLETVRQRVTKR